VWVSERRRSPQRRVAPSTVIRGADIVQLSSILSGTFRPGGRMAGAGRNSHVSRDINGLTWQMGVGNRCVVALKDLPMPRPGVRGIQCGGCRGRRQMTSRREAGGHGRNYLRDASGCLSQPGKSCATSWTAPVRARPLPTFGKATARLKCDGSRSRVRLPKMNTFEASTLNSSRHPGCGACCAKRWSLSERSSISGMSGKDRQAWRVRRAVP
jgi:hypothetical protein